MRVSVIIPIYNISSYLCSCLDSCINQIYQNLEIICIDDGSTDNSGMIADAYASKDSRIRVVHKPNGGLPSARKAGIELAQGDYIFHLDGDDDIPVDAIYNLVKIAEVNDADIVLGDYFAYAVDGKKRYVSSRLSQPISGYDYLQYIFIQGLFNIWGKLIRRSLYFDNQIQIPPSISMGEDLIAITQLAYYSKTVAICKSATYNYYVRPSSMSITTKRVVGELTDRSIYAVDFVVRFLVHRADADTLYLLSNFVKHFVYEYMRSPYSVSLRRYELNKLCGFIKNYKSSKYSFRELVCCISYSSLGLAKTVARLRNWL